MDEPILIHPDNRMLANSASNDFSLYGAPAEAEVLIGPATAPGDAGLPGSQHSAGTPIAEPSHALAHGAFPLSHAGTDAAPEGAPAAPAIIAFAPAAPSFAPSAEGSGGSLTPIALAPASPPAAAPILPGQAEGSAALPDLSVPTVAAPLPSPAPVEAAAQPAIAAAEPAAAIAAPVESVIEDAAGAVAAPVQALLDQAAPLAPVLDALDAVVGAAPADALGAIDDGVQDLLGADPAGGISTLVSLVSISDVLDVREAGSDTPSTGDDPVSMLLDTLSADPAGGLAGTEHDGDDGDDGAAALVTLTGTSDDDDDAGDLLGL
jgi:hypothetical protein